MKKSESGALKIKELERVVFDRMKKNVKYKKMQELGASGKSLRGEGDGFRYEGRAVMRSSHSIISKKEYYVNNYFYGKNATTGGGGGPRGRG